MPPNDDRPQPSYVARQVDDLVLRACAAVRRPGESQSIGTAFRISPKYVITASHVVDGAEGSQWDLLFAEVGGNGGGADDPVTVPAVVVRATPGVVGRAFPMPDVAVLRIDPAAAPDAPPVLLGEPEPEIDSSLRVCGLNLEKGDPSFERLKFIVADALEDLRLDANVLRPGKSGGPVYSHEDGSVCAFVKASIHPNIPLGGFCVPVLQALRDACDDDLYRDIVHSHDAHHRARKEWFSLAIGDTAARERYARVMGLFPELVEPVGRAEVNDYYRELCPSFATPLRERRLVALRDLAEFIRVRTGTAIGEVPRMTKLCLAAMARPGTPPAVREELKDHALTVARRWGVPYPAFQGLRLQAAQGPPIDVIIGVVQACLTAVQDGEPHEWELFRYQQGEVISQTGACSAVSYEAATGALRRAIHEYLDSTAQDVEIQVALPDGRLSGEHLAAWRRRGADGRDLDRFSDDNYRVVPRRSRTFVRSVGARGLMTRHLAGLAEAGAGALAWLDCWDGHDEEQLGNLFATRHGAGSNEPPNELVFTKTDQRSYPLMVWRRSRCEDHAAQELCAGRRFRRELVSSLTENNPDRWRKQVLDMHTELVRGTLEDGDPRRGWCDVVYVLDRPELTRRAAPLGAG
ncbi:hypothetical protein GCM10009839_41380 [Catenulispora yoronensis]|uniref:Serine protease n=1 Tax=Catenulispora yoronensis TaxID=450799 RepID=A0ABN2UHM2_9ACTN